MRAMNRAASVSLPVRWLYSRGWGPSWLAPHAVVMGLAFLGALVIGYLLLPGENERIAMLERDGHDAKALQILEHRFAAGDRDVRSLFQLQSLYEQKGDLVRARQMLDLLADARPRDPTVQRQVSEFYRITQDEPAYVKSLEQRLANRFSQPICKELIGLYRRAGKFDLEQRTIMSCSNRGYRRTDDIVRLARLIAVDGRLPEAAALLRSVDDKRRLTEDADRLMLFAALLDAGAATEAKQRAARWFKGSKDEGFVLQIIDNLAADNRHELAIDLAREVGRPGDSISLAVGELMLDREQIIPAQSYLRGWLEVAKIGDEEVAQRVLRAALDAEDPMLAYRAGEIFGLRRMPQEDLVALAEALSAINQQSAFQAVRELIAPGSLKENLLLAAAVEFEKGKAEPARQLLSRIEVKALDEWRLALWARLMTSTGRRATAQQTLKEIQAEVRSGNRRPIGPLAEEFAGIDQATEREAGRTVPSGTGGAAQRPGPSTVSSPVGAVARPPIIRKTSNAPTKGPPRKSRLKKASPPPPAVKGPGQAKSIPFPVGG